jgi:N-acetylneuraminic acid mutarotase
LQAQCTAGSQWRQETALPTAIQEVASSVIGTKMHVMSKDKHYMHDFGATTGNYWVTLASPPSPGDHYAAVTIGTKIYLVGGLADLRGDYGDVQVYDTITNTWAAATNMPYRVHGSINTVLLRGEIHACGGLNLNGGGDPQNPIDCFRLNPSTLQWTRFASMLYGVDHAAFATDGDHMFVLGGRNNGVNAPAVGNDWCQKYTYDTDTWSMCAPLPFKRGGSGPAVLWNGKMIVMGGESSESDAFTYTNGNNMHPQVSAYDIATDTWTTQAFDDMIDALHGIHAILCVPPLPPTRTHMAPPPPPPPDHHHHRRCRRFHSCLPSRALYHLLFNATLALLRCLLLLPRCIAHAHTTRYTSSPLRQVQQPHLGRWRWKLTR